MWRGPGYRDPQHGKPSNRSRARNRSERSDKSVAHSSAFRKRWINYLFNHRHLIPRTPRGQRLHKSLAQQASILFAADGETTPVLQSIDISDYLFPKELQVKKVPLENIILIGSCLSGEYLTRFRDIDHDLKIRHIFLNNLQKLPALTTTQLATYQLQYIQLPLREVLTDRIVRICDLDREQGFEAILGEARTILTAMLDNAMAYNIQSGILTIVANFLVPQGHVASSLAGLGGEDDLTVLIAELNLTLTHLVRNYRNAYVADVNSVANSYGKWNFLDDIVYFYTHGSVLGSEMAINEAWDLHDNRPAWSAPEPARVELVPSIQELYQLQVNPFFNLVLDQIRYINRIALQVDQVKIVIFDLDNTLWRGQIAEHYEVGRVWPDLHNWPVGMWETIQHLRRRGIVVSICSKNDESVVRERWTRAVSLPWISLDDFIAPKINWAPKSENVRAILSELNLTPNSAVFVDDNPVERSKVVNEVPGIRTVGGNPFVTRRILLWAAETQRSFMTDESIGRESSYRGMVARNTEMRSTDRESFLKSLKIRVQLDHIIDVDSPVLPRVLELANKTTQFNTTGLKWTPSALRSFIADQGSVFAFNVSDKFADYGLAGAVFIRGGVIVQFVMSCRVLGNDVEVTALREVLDRVRDQSEGPLIFGTITRTDVNGPCQDIFLRSGFRATETPDSFTIMKSEL